MERLFVYGTLAPGRQNHHVIEHISGHWEVASVRGILLDEGWGADLGFPGFVPSDEGDRVEGFLFSSNELEEHWSMLDSYEGSGYTRIVVTVCCESGEQRAGYVYALNRDV